MGEEAIFWPLARPEGQLPRGHKVAQWLSLPTALDRTGEQGKDPGALDLEFSSNSKNVVTLSLPWGFGWRSKGEIH